jgi:hypothetical protein
VVPRAFVNGADLHVEAIYGVPELHECHCQQIDQSTGFMFVSQRTESTCSFSGIVEVRHDCSRKSLEMIGPSGRQVRP